MKALSMIIGRSLHKLDALFFLSLIQVCKKSAACLKVYDPSNFATTSLEKISSLNFC